MKITKVEALANIANDIRIGMLEQVYEAQSGHPGGALSCSDILAVLYFNQMNIDPKQPEAPGRDRFVLSKGHCSPALYATLARKGYFDKAVCSSVPALSGRWQFRRGAPQFHRRSRALYCAKVCGPNGGNGLLGLPG